MAWPEDGEPTTEDLIELTRLYLGDDDSCNPLFRGVQIETVLKLQGGSPVAAAATLACARAAQVAGNITRKIGDESSNCSDEYRHWSELAEKLGNSGRGLVPAADGGCLGGIFIGGITDVEKSASSNDGYVDLYFKVGQDDNLRCDDD